MIKCKVCGSDTISYIHPKFHTLYHECQECEFIFKDEKHYISKKEELKKYDEHHNSLDNIGYVNYLTDFIETAVVPFIKKGEALDFGSGPSPVLAHILKNNYKFDVDIFDLYYAIDKVYVNKSYDLITSTEVIEHLNNPLETFELFNKHLKPNGILSIMTLFHPKNRDLFFDWHYIRDDTHVSFFTTKTLRVIAKMYDFKLIDTNDYRYAVFQKYNTTHTP